MHAEVVGIKIHKHLSGRFAETRPEVINIFKLEFVPLRISRCSGDHVVNGQVMDTFSHRIGDHVLGGPYQMQWPVNLRALAGIIDVRQLGAVHSHVQRVLRDRGLLGGTGETLQEQAHREQGCQCGEFHCRAQSPENAGGGFGWAMHELLPFSLFVWLSSTLFSESEIGFGMLDLIELGRAQN